MVSGSLFGSGIRRILSIAVPIFQIVLYCSLTAVGDAQVKAHDEYIEDLARHGVAFDTGSSIPICHEIAFGLNLPLMIVPALIFIPVIAFAGGYARAFLDPDRSLEFQILIGSMVPFLWFAVVRWAFETKDAMDSSRNANIVKLIGLVCATATAVLSIWICRGNQIDRSISRSLLACWFIFGLYSVTANKLLATSGRLQHIRD
jgi:hypothetical protein